MNVHHAGYHDIHEELISWASDPRSQGIYDLDRSKTRFHIYKPK